MSANYQKVSPSVALILMKELKNKTKEKLK